MIKQVAFCLPPHRNIQYSTYCWLIKKTILFYMEASGQHGRALPWDLLLHTELTSWYVSENAVFVSKEQPLRENKFMWCTVSFACTERKSCIYIEATHFAWSPHERALPEISYFGSWTDIVTCFREWCIRFQRATTCGKQHCVIYGGELTQTMPKSVDAEGIWFMQRYLLWRFTFGYRIPTKNSNKLSTTLWIRICTYWLQSRLVIKALQMLSNNSDYTAPRTFHLTQDLNIIYY